MKIVLARAKMARSVTYRLVPAQCTYVHRLRKEMQSTLQAHAFFFCLLGLRLCQLLLEPAVARGPASCGLSSLGPCSNCNLETAQSSRQPARLDKCPMN